MTAAARRRRIDVAYALGAGLAIACGPGCGQGSALRGRVGSAIDLAASAEKNGGLQCAPRELALAKAYLHFATVDLDQGQPSEAHEHLLVAEPNAAAAYAMSPPGRCSAARNSDSDGDGIPDDVDRCPQQRETWNTVDDTDGCPDDPDTDGDGVPDSRDLCVAEPEDVDGYLDDDGCPDLDNDGDGVPDATDQCKDRPEDLDGYLDDDGCPDPDNDGDSVADLEDMCPNTAGSPSGDRPGCPKKDALVVITEKEIRIVQQIQFELNKATIKSASYRILDEVRDALREHPTITLEIQGHTDNVGDSEHNLRLSESRAQSVRQYLISHAIEGTRLSSRGYGMQQPLVKNDTAAHRALNRRVQFIRTENIAR